MTNPITFQAAKTVICHGGGAIHLLDYQPGTKIWTGQPTVEDFDTPIEAIQRYVELGGDIQETKHLWPEGQVPTEQAGTLQWMSLAPAAAAT